MLAPVLALLIASSAIANDTTLKFKGGIVEIPVIGTPGAPVANAVRGIQPAGTPWVIRALRAEVKADGRIHVEGRGLLLAGGNEVGTNGGAGVFASLISGPLPNGPFTVSSTPVANAVALAADGDFTIDDVLSPAPPLDCDNQVLLIRNVGMTWFAAGIPVVGI
jgi:hypothetical protein